ncbi:MAG: LapA family protein [Isosphaeraceae bacterium]|nr:LapA family protein [Isosphaeraceae bacterium]
MRYIQALALLIFLAAVVIFAVQNTQTITVRFLDWGLTAPTALMIVAVYLLGMISGWSLVSFLRLSLRRVTEHRRD